MCGTFLLSRVHDQTNLMLCRDTTSEGHADVTLIYAFALDLCWAIELITYALFASGEEYVVSYGQVWLCPPPSRPYTY